MSEPDYLYDNDWTDARERLLGLECVEDEATFGHLDRIGVAERWHCLEVGAGAGSVAAWLCGRVGSAGRVVATDLDTRFLEELTFPHLEVRRHDLTTDGFEAGAFDLAHVRHVLIHLGDPQAALRRMAWAVKPGGWVLVEESDFVTEGAEPSADKESAALYGRVKEQIHALYRERGMDLRLGAAIPGLLPGLGFETVRSEDRMRVVCGGSDEARFHCLTFGQLKQKILAAGEIAEVDYDRFLALHDDPAFAYRSRLTVSTWGRRPEH